MEQVATSCAEWTQLYDAAPAAAFTGTIRMDRWPYYTASFEAGVEKDFDSSFLAQDRAQDEEDA